MDAGIGPAYPRRAMSARIAVRLAWTLGATSFVLAGVASGFELVNRAHGHANPWIFSIVAAAVGFGGVGSLISARRPANPIGWMLLAAGLGHALSGAGSGYGEYAATAGYSGAAIGLWVGKWAWIPLGLVPAVFLLFPSGRLLSRRWRAALVTAVALPPLLMVGTAIYPQRVNDDPPVENPFGISGVKAPLDVASAGAALLFGVLLLLSAAALVLRYRRAAGDERAQIKWVTLGAAALVVQFPIEASGDEAVAGVTSAILLTIFAGTLGIAILRHRLLDVDVVLNRTLVYGSLTAGVVGGYLGIVELAGALFHEHGGLAASLAATGAIALVFAPLRTRLQRRVDRMLYGQRSDPYAVISRLGERLEEARPEDVLPALVEEVAATLKLPYSAIELEGEPPVAVGERTGELLELPLTYQGEAVGRLLLGPRSPGEAFSRVDLLLFEGLARQVGVAAYAVRLTRDLQHSRERLVAAREEERRRLRNDLHDGLGPLLAGVTLQLGAARTVLRSDPDRVDELLGRLVEETQSAIADLRRLVYDLRPPALDELGLVPAIREQAARFEARLTVSVEAPDDLSGLPAAVEVAVYRIATEALTNVARHAEARACSVRIVLNGAVEVEVRDDGKGLPPGAAAGIGLSSIRERAAELGGASWIGRGPEGGTIVRARLPLVGG